MLTRWTKSSFKIIRWSTKTSTKNVHWNLNKLFIFWSKKYNKIAFYQILVSFSMDVSLTRLNLFCINSQHFFGVWKNVIKTKLNIQNIEISEFHKSFSDWSLWQSNQFRYNNESLQFSWHILSSPDQSSHRKRYEFSEFYSFWEIYWSQVYYPFDRLCLRGGRTGRVCPWWLCQYELFINEMQLDGPTRNITSQLPERTVLLCYTRRRRPFASRMEDSKNT